MSENNREFRKPFLLRPSGKDYLWGGRRLNDEFAKKIEMNPLAETWECSTHPDGPSFVVGGEFHEKSLAEVLRKHPEYVGTHPVTSNSIYGTGELPVLIKFIDANKDLSVQVHPDDEFAAANEGGQLGKTEMWYVLDAAKEAHLVYGLKCDVTEDELRKSIDEGSLGKYLQKVPVEKNDIFFIEPGTIHAIGAGVLVAEIQENSNLTYRLYDYNRFDKSGNKRELHIDKAIKVANLSGSIKPKQPLRVLNYKPGIASELLGRCKYFQVHRLIINTERRQDVLFKSDELSFRILLCVNGCGTMSYVLENTSVETKSIFKGDCFFVPADSIEIHLHGKMQLLDVRG